MRILHDARGRMERWAGDAGPQASWRDCVGAASKVRGQCVAVAIHFAGKFNEFYAQWIACGKVPGHNADGRCAEPSMACAADESRMYRWRRWRNSEEVEMSIKICCAKLCVYRQEERHLLSCNFGACFRGPVSGVSAVDVRMRREGCGGEKKRRISPGLKTREPLRVVLREESMWRRRQSKGASPRGELGPTKSVLTQPDKIGFVSVYLNPEGMVIQMCGEKVDPIAFQSS